MSFSNDKDASNDKKAGGMIKKRYLQTNVIYTYKAIRTMRVGFYGYNITNLLVISYSGWMERAAVKFALISSCFDDVEAVFNLRTYLFLSSPSGAAFFGVLPMVMVTVTVTVTVTRGYATHGVP